MFRFQGISDQLSALFPSRSNPPTPAKDPIDTMGSKQSKPSPSGSPRSLSSRSQSSSQGSSVMRTKAEKQRRLAHKRKRQLSSSPSSRHSEEADEPMPDSSEEIDDGIDADSDLEMAGDDDYGSHHSDLPSEASDQPDPDSDAESHPSGIGSDRSVHTNPDEEGYEAEPVDDDEMAVDDKVDHFLEVQDKIRMSKDVDKSDWHEMEVQLFDELDLRGTQPLLPMLWKGDFPTCPLPLFSSNPDETYINSMSGAEFAGSRALRDLVALGSRIRSVGVGSRTREQVIFRGIQEYITWSEKDGGYARKKFDPILTVTCGIPGQPIDEITTLTEGEMFHLASLQRNALLLDEGDETHPAQFTMDPPLIYGVMIAGSFVIFVTIDSADPEARPKTVAHFNYDDPTMDVWNGFAIAILVIAVRDWMAPRCADKPDLPETDDPDA